MPGDASPVAVLHLLNGEQYSGLERMVDDLVAAAPANGFRLVLALLKPDRMRGRMAAGCGEVHEVPMRSRIDLGVAARVAAIAAASGCRLVHSHTVRSALVANRVKGITGLPWMHHVHSPALHESAHKGMNLANYLAEAAVLRRADRVVTVSQALGGYVRRHYRIDESRVLVMHNGVADAGMHASPVESAVAGAGIPRPSPNGLPATEGSSVASGVFTILTLGLFRPRKGIGNLVQAAGLLRDAGHDFRLQLAGEFADPGYEASIHREVDRLRLRDRVEFLGFIGRVEAVLRACDVFTLPSLHGEGMPMAVLEAMAHGRPVVASDVDGIRELIHGGAGLLVTPGEPGALANALSSLITAPPLRVRLGRAAQARQRRHYSLPAVHRRLFESYRSLLAEDAAGTRRRRRS